MNQTRLARLLILFLVLATTLTGCSTGLLHWTQQKTAAQPKGTAQQQSGSGFLHTDGATLVDSNCHQVHLSGVNWFGMETTSFAPHGLDVRNWQDMLNQMVLAGFNTIRLPFTDQFLDPSSMPQGINYHLNPDLVGLHGLSLLDKLIQGARQRGLKIILDRHYPTPDQPSPLWYTNEMPESTWIADWVMLAEHYRGNDTIIGADLDGEPHGVTTWGSDDPATDWHLAAERAGNAILAANPDWLIIVEGIEIYNHGLFWWGGNLQGAGDYPVYLSEPDKLVYSAHDYGPDVYPQSYFWAANFPQNLTSVWESHWAYLQEQNQAPVLIGEFGANTVSDTTVEGVWFRTLMDFMKQHNMSYTYWAWNPDSSDTGGLLQADWQTLDPAKMSILSTYQSPLLDRPTIKVKEIQQHYTPLRAAQCMD